MWLGDITFDTSGVNVTDTSAPVDTSTPAPTGPSTSASLINLAADLASVITPYKSGVPVNLAISPQTQSFLIMGGVLLGGLLLLNMIRR